MRATGRYLYLLYFVDGRNFADYRVPAIVTVTDAIHQDRPRVGHRAPSPLPNQRVPYYLRCCALSPTTAPAHVAARARALLATLTEPCHPL